MGGSGSMRYFDYQPKVQLGKIWELFSEMNSRSEAEILGQTNSRVQYSHTIEIINAALSGSLSVSDESIKYFSLSAYEYACAKNEDIDRKASYATTLFLVSEGEDEDKKAGYGEYSDAKLKIKERPYDDFENRETFSENIKRLVNINKVYLRSKGIDVIRLLKNSLKNDKQSTKRLKLLLDEDMELQELVVDLCEDGSEGTLEKILGEL